MLYILQQCKFCLKVKSVVMYAVAIKLTMFTNVDSSFVSHFY